MSKTPATAKQLMAERRSAPSKRAVVTPKIQRAVEIMLYGTDDEPAPKTLQRAAQLAGISDRHLRGQLKRPHVAAYYRAELKAMRESLKAEALATTADVMRDPTLKENAAGRKVQLQAAQSIWTDPEQARNSLSVDVNVALQQTVPGYVIDLSKYDANKITEGLRRHAFNQDATRTIEGEAEEIA